MIFTTKKYDNAKQCFTDETITLDSRQILQFQDKSENALIKISYKKFGGVIDEKFIRVDKSTEFLEDLCEQDRKRMDELMREFCKAENGN